MDDFLFIPHESGSGRIASARSRSTIRAHVKRRAQPQSQPPSRQSSRPQPVVSSTVQPRSIFSPYELSPSDDDLQATGESAHLSSSVRNLEQLGRRFCGSQESFAYAGLAIHPRCCYFFRRYAAEFKVILSNAAQPVELVGQPYVCYMAIQQNSPALLHAICSTAALYEAFVRARTGIITIDATVLQEAAQGAYYHKTISLQLLNFALGGPIAEGPALEAMLLCVLVLLHESAVTGEADDVMVHTGGLVRIVQLLGGESALSADSGTKILSEPPFFLALTFEIADDRGPATEAWLVDVKSSLVRRAKPMLSLTPHFQQLLDDVLNSTDNASDPPPFAIKFCSAFFESPLRDQLSPPLIRYLIYTRRLKSALTGIRREHKRLMPRVIDDFVALEHGLARLPYETDLSLFEDCIRIAVVLYINTAMWKIPLYCAWISSLANQLKERLEALSIGDAFSHCPGLLLWLCFSGRYAMSAVSNPTVKLWWSRSIKESARMLDLTDWEDVEKEIAVYCYVHDIYSIVWEGFWEEALELDDERVLPRATQ